MRPSRLRAVLPPILFALCAAVALPAQVHAQWPPQSLENLQVLPKDITFQELFRTMSGFTRALGVRCSYCHVGDPNASLAEYDFASDEKATKKKAREMLRMVDQINNVNLAGLPAPVHAGGERPVRHVPSRRAGAAHDPGHRVTGIRDRRPRRGAREIS